MKKDTVVNISLNGTKRYYDAGFKIKKILPDGTTIRYKKKVKTVYPDGMKEVHVNNKLTKRVHPSGKVDYYD